MEKMSIHIIAHYKWKMLMDLIVVNLKIQKIKSLDTAISNKTITEMKPSLREIHQDVLQSEIHPCIEAHLEI
jgi:hypothetical protein